MLEGAEAGDRVEATEARRGSTCRASSRRTSRPWRRQASACADESVTPTPGRPALADEGEQRAPAAAEVEHAPAGPDPDLLGDVLVLAPLRLLERQREVAVVLRAAEVGQLAEAEPEDPVDQRVGELEVLAVGHSSCGRVAGWAPISRRRLRLGSLPWPPMLSTNQFKNGTHIEVEGTIYRIMEFQHVKPGKGGAFVRSKLRKRSRTAR